MNTAYPLIPVFAIIVTLYFVTWLFSKWDIFPLNVHLKFWNYILLITFLVSGLSGLISVIKINYRLEISIYDQLLKWHVSFGIGMAIIAFLHFSNHLSYYFPQLRKYNLFRKKSVVDKTGNEPKTKVPYLLFLLGVITMINQVVFIREFMSVLAGNELVLGVTMATWMLITGWGAFTGRKKLSASFSFTKGINMLIFLAFMPAILIGFLFLLKYMLFPPGTITGLGTAVTGAFFLLFPVCFLSGYLFTALATLLSESENKNRIGKSYAYESIGSLAGGLLFSFILGRFFNSFQILGLTTCAIIFTGAFINGWPDKRRTAFLLIAGIILPVIIFITNPDTRLKRILLPNQNIILNKSTRYGNLVITEQAGQLNFYENNSLQFYTENIMMNEEAVHFAMARHKMPERILLISGGIAGMIKEIKKYDVEKITYLENNPEVFLHWETQLPDSGKFDNVEIIRSDIRSFLSRSKDIYDIILLNIPEPSTIGYNRFYTYEFFKLIKGHCDSNSIVCTNLPSTANYAEENALEINSSLWKTLSMHFSNMLLIPGEKNYFLASDTVLGLNITDTLNRREIENEYVNQYYIDENLLKMRSETIVSQFNPDTKINRDFKPYIFVKQSNHWLSHFNTSYWLIIVIPALLFLIMFLKQNPLTIGLYTGGFTASSLEIVMMLTYQVFVGSIYLSSAFFFAAFMGGLSTGSYRTITYKKNKKLRHYYGIQFSLAIFSMMLPFLVNIIDYISGYVIVVQTIFFFLVFTLAFGIGFEFNLASELQGRDFSTISGTNYSTDLAGSAFGAFLTSIFLLPALGLTNTCIIIAGLNIISGIVTWSSRNKRIFA
jgi:spermidine synthase